MRPDRIVMAPPAFDDDRNLSTCEISGPNEGCTSGLRRLHRPVKSCGMIEVGGDLTGPVYGPRRWWRRLMKRTGLVGLARPNRLGNALVNTQSLWNIMAGCLTKTKRSIAWL